jgi:heptaprenyl diphosphate synthase
MPQLAVTPEDRRIARLAVIAVTLTLAEAALPSPLPGVKPGLANIVVLWVLLQHGWRDAVWVSLLRVLAGSLLLGSFLTPGFWLSASGAITSLLALGVAHRLPARWFGPVSLSLIAAFAHLAGQLTLVAAWLLPVAAVLALLPIFALAALVTGLANGLIVARLLAGQAPPQAQSAHA